MGDSLASLAIALAQLPSRSDLYWNDAGRRENCVWVSTARYFGLQVTELEEQVGKDAPPGGASETQIRDFLEAIHKWDTGGPDSHPGFVVIGNGSFTQLTQETVIVCYRRGDGTGHCVLKEGAKYTDYQSRDDGEDVTSEVMQSTIVLSWIFIRPCHAGGNSPL